MGESPDVQGENGAEAKSIGVFRDNGACPAGQAASDDGGIIYGKSSSNPSPLADTQTHPSRNRFTRLIYANRTNMLNNAKGGARGCEDDGWRKRKKVFVSAAKNLPLEKFVCRK